MSNQGRALTYAICAFLGFPVSFTSTGTSFIALCRDGAVVAHEVRPAGAPSVHAQALPAAIVLTACLVIVDVPAIWPSLGLIRTYNTTAVGAFEANIANAPAIHAQAIAGAIIGALAQLHIKSHTLAVPTSPSVIALTLTRTMRRHKRADAMSAAIT